MAKVLWLQNLWIEFSGIMFISSLLKEKGHQSDILFDTKEGIVEAIRRENPDCIAFSCMTVQWKWAQEISSYIKSQGIRTPIIAGGIHTTMYPDVAISHPAIDAICLNEGELPMLDFMNALDKGQDFSTVQNLWVRREDGEIVKNSMRPKLPPEVLDSMPFADRDLYKKYDYFRNYSMEIFVGSRGCPFTCTFCEVPFINDKYGGKRVHYRDPVKFVDEIEACKNRGLLDRKLVMFTDSTFNSNKKWFMRFLDEYKRRIDVPFSANLRVDLVDEDQVKAMKEAGCDNVRFGVESGDVEIRNRILEKHCTDEQIYKCADLLHKYKIPFVTFNLFGCPDETLEQAWKTIAMNRRVRPAAMGAYVFVLFPQIAATNYAIKAGLIEESDLAKLDQHPYNLHLSILRPEKQPDIIRICNLQKFAILVTRLPWLEPVVRQLIKLEPADWMGTFYSLSQVWEWRRWSTKSNVRRLLYEGILNYQALVQTTSKEKSVIRSISMFLYNKWKKKKMADQKQPAPLTEIEGFRERALQSSSLQ